MYILRAKIKAMDHESANGRIIAKADVTLSNGVVLESIYIVEKQSGKLSFDYEKMMRRNKSPLINSLKNLGFFERTNIESLLRPIVTQLQIDSENYRIDILAKSQISDNQRLEPTSPSSYVVYANKVRDISAKIERELIEDLDDDLDEVIDQLRGYSFSEDEIANLVQTIIDNGGLEITAKKMKIILETLNTVLLDEV